MPQDLTDNKSILIQVMAWCRQAITWASVDSVLCPHMAALGLNVLMTEFLTLFSHLTFLCPIVMASPGHCVLLQPMGQDIMSY